MAKKGSKLNLTDINANVLGVNFPSHENLQVLGGSFEGDRLVFSLRYTVEGKEAEIGVEYYVPANLEEKYITASNPAERYIEDTKESDKDDLRDIEPYTDLKVEGKVVPAYTAKSKKNWMMEKIRGPKYILQCAIHSNVKGLLLIKVSAPTEQIIDKTAKLLSKISEPRNT